jgi:cytochrome oxidase Cu insertion factor (SCO1/SenC/PrrC family)
MMLSPMLAIASDEWQLPEALLADVTVVDQSNTAHQFFEDLIKNRTVAINFIFSSCTSSCPLSTAIFRQVQKKLGKQKVQFITISVDPVNDTPERLLEFSKRFKAEPGWAFITGEKPVISGLLKSLGTFAADKNEHSNMVIIGNEVNHQWMRLYGLPQAEEILAALKNVTGASRRQ